METSQENRGSILGKDGEKRYTFAVSLRRGQVIFLLSMLFLAAMLFFWVGFYWGLRGSSVPSEEQVLELDSVEPGEFPLNGKNDLNLGLNSESILSFEGKQASSLDLLEKDRRDVGGAAITRKKEVKRVNRGAQSMRKKPLRVKKAGAGRSEKRAAGASGLIFQPNKTYYYLQLIVTSSLEKARGIRGRLIKRGYLASIKKSVLQEAGEEQEVVYVVRVGLFTEKQMALRSLDRIREAGYRDAYLRIYRKR